MTTAIKRRRGTTAQHSTFTGLEGELTVDTTKDTVVVHDGATAGGFPLAKESGSALSATTLAYTGTLTGGTGVVNLGSGQFYKDASGNVGIGTSSPVRALSIYGASSAFSSFQTSVSGAASTDGLLVGADGSNAYVYNFESTPILFGTNASERMRIDASGNLLVGKTSATSNGGDVQVSKGITFPATQSASSDANTLDDYEEGTFTPEIVGSTTNGTASYTAQLGKYTKIGNTVTISIYVIWSGGTGTGNLEISGLPFTPTGSNYYTTFSVRPSNIALTALNVLCAISSTQGTAKIYMNQTPTGGGASSNVPYDAAGDLILGGTYFV